MNINNNNNNKNNDDSNSLRVVLPMARGPALIPVEHLSEISLY